jgi:hypothetical protein
MRPADYDYKADPPNEFCKLSRHRTVLQLRSDTAHRFHETDNLAIREVAIHGQKPHLNRCLDVFESGKRRAGQKACRWGSRPDIGRNVARWRILARIAASINRATLKHNYLPPMANLGPLLSTPQPYGSTIETANAARSPLQRS